MKMQKRFHYVCENFKCENRRGFINNIKYCALDFGEWHIIDSSDFEFTDLPVNCIHIKVHKDLSILESL